MKNKKPIIALIALVVLVALMVGIYIATRPQPKPADGTKGTQAQTNASDSTDDTTQPTFAKNFTVIVVHSDGTSKTFTYGTNADYLGPVLVENGLVEAAASPGMYDTIDGEKADWNVDQSYWAFYVGEDYAMQGMDDTPINDGDTFKLVYTIG